MPRMNGQALVKRIATLKPDAQAVFIQKPFTMDAPQHDPVDGLPRSSRRGRPALDTTTADHRRIISTGEAMNQGRAQWGLTGLIMMLACGSVAAEAPTWRVTGGDVNIKVPLKPGGAFGATTSSLNGTLTLDQSKPARLTREISIDLATIETGIALRNQHLREKYLEVAKGSGYDRAVLSEIQLHDAADEAFEGRTAFSGVLLLHGVKRPVEGTAEIRREGLGRRVRADFLLVLTDFGITPPVYLGVGVGNKLIVKAQFTAMPVREPGK